MTPRRSLVWWSVAVVTACGLAATAHGMYAVAVACGVSQPVAVLYPVIADGLALAAYAATTRLRSWGQFYAWLVVVVAANLSGLAQGWHLASLGDRPGTTWALRFGMGYGVAVVCTVAAHLLWLVGRPRGVEAARSVGEVREEVADADGSGTEERPDPSAPDSNGHGKTKLEKAVAARLAFEAEHGRRPSRPELALLAGVSESTARDALAGVKRS